MFAVIILLTLSGNLLYFTVGEWFEIELALRNIGRFKLYLTLLFYLFMQIRSFYFYLTIVDLAGVGLSLAPRSCSCSS